MDSMDRLRKYIKTPVLAALPVFWLAIIIIVFTLTSPLNAGPAGILLVFGLFYIFTNSLLFLVLHTVVRIWAKVANRTLLSGKTTYYLASAIAFGPVFLVALNTLSRIGIVEVVLVSLFLLLVCFYVLRRAEA